jgi:hypothetical protein
MSTIFLGIDVGLEGAIAVLGWRIDPVVYDTPILKIKTKDKTKREYDLPRMREILQPFVIENDVLVILEYANAHPDQGVSSVFSFGRGTGLWEGLLTGLELPYVKVTPKKWKHALLEGLPSGKGASIVVAKRLFPKIDFPRVKDHGKADAILLAEYGKRTYRPNWEGETNGHKLQNAMS